MQFDERFFDAGIDRMGTQCAKWEAPDIAAEGMIPLWVADMDFACAPAIVEALVERAWRACYGYTFPEVVNPVDGKPTEWSEKTVKLDPWEPVKSVVDYLFADPGEVTFPTAYEVITAVANLASALQTTGHLPTV